MTPNPAYEALRSKPRADWQRFSERETYELYDSALRILAALDPPEDLRPLVFEGVKVFLGNGKQIPQAVGIPLDSRILGR